KDKCVVIAVDTALRSLLNQNCIPDIVVSLDAQKENFNDFKGIDIQDFILVYDLTINPKILDWYKGERKLCSIIGQHLKTCEGADYVKFEPLFDYIKDSIGDTGYLQTGGSVSTIALDLARNMECDPIIFSGQDLAYTGLKTHSADSYDMLAYASSQTKFHTFETNLFSYYSNKSLFPVKGNFSETVYTDTTLKHYQNWISDAAKIMKQKIFNATEGGAYIPNTEKKTLSELSEALPVINKNILNRINQNKKIKINRDILSMKIKTDLDFLDKSLKRVKLAIQELKHGKSIFESLADFKKLKEIILENNYSFLDLYKNKYYVMLKQLYSLNLEEAAFEKNDLELFFLNMEYGLEKIPSFLKRIIE
ncbi:MAG TPA: DUF115 domain-containing protein, partial [bacterium]|nr:DUF115 domain-containing protein [bacterium]